MLLDISVASRSVTVRVVAHVEFRYWLPLVFFCAPRFGALAFAEINASVDHACLRTQLNKIDLVKPDGVVAGRQF